MTCGCRANRPRQAVLALLGAWSRWVHYNAHRWPFRRWPWRLTAAPWFLARPFLRETCATCGRPWRKCDAREWSPERGHVGMHRLVNINCRACGAVL